MSTSKEDKDLRAKALSQLRKGQSLFGKDGAFKPLLQEILQAALEAEMGIHLDQTERAKGNKRNGKGTKTVRTREGTFTIQTPEDRQSTFQPQIIRKRETILADSLQEKIIGLYGLGMSYRDIRAHLVETYDLRLSPEKISEITDRIIPLVRAWQTRPLAAVYTIVWLDAMYFKIQEEGSVKSKVLYNVLAVDPEGRKHVLGAFMAETEGAKFWLHVLTDLQHRGVKDILIACADNLPGFAEAILSVFPATEVQTCVVHQIRNSLKYIATKDKLAFMEALRQIYQALNKIVAEEALERLETNWGSKYPLVVKSWRNNWNKLSCYFEYGAEIRRLIYTTNPIEAFHRRIRKVTKSKGAFSGDLAVLKLVYLVTERLSQQWETPLQNWGLIAQQLRIKFGSRMPMSLSLNS